MDTRRVKSMHLFYETRDITAERLLNILTEILAAEPTPINVINKLTMEAVMKSHPHQAVIFAAGCVIAQSHLCLRENIVTPQGLGLICSIGNLPVSRL